MINKKCCGRISKIPPQLCFYKMVLYAHDRTRLYEKCLSGFVLSMIYILSVQPNLSGFLPHWIPVSSS